MKLELGFKLGFNISGVIPTHLKAHCSVNSLTRLCKLRFPNLDRYSSQASYFKLKSAEKNKKITLQKMTFL